jgi:hypothetical protein
VFDSTDGDNSTEPKNPLDRPPMIEGSKLVTEINEKDSNLYRSK